MLLFIRKIKYRLLQQASPHTEAGLCRSLPAEMWGFALLFSLKLI